VPKVAPFHQVKKSVKKRFIGAESLSVMRGRSLLPPGVRAVQHPAFPAQCRHSHAAGAKRFSATGVISKGPASPPSPSPIPFTCFGGPARKEKLYVRTQP
jgi:hypothetical protein